MLLAWSLWRSSWFVKRQNVGKRVRFDFNDPGKRAVDGDNRQEFRKD
jgi:hypothetical protein